MELGSLLQSHLVELLSSGEHRIKCLVRHVCSLRFLHLSIQFYRFMIHPLKIAFNLPSPGQVNCYKDDIYQTGLKLENYYFFTFTFSRPEVRKLLLFYVFTFSRPEVRKLLLFYFRFFFSTWSWKIIPYLLFSTWSWNIIPYLRFYFFSTWSWNIIPYLRFYFFSTCKTAVTPVN